MNKTVLSLILLLMIVCTPGVQAQVYNEMDASGNIKTSIPTSATP